MTDANLSKCLMGALIIISCTMFVWTINYIQAQANINIPTAISAYNG